MQETGDPHISAQDRGPSVVLIFLEDYLDTQKREIRKWHDHRACSKRELLSLLGQLQHACCVVKPGQSFIRRMIDLSTTVRENLMHYMIRLNEGFRSDLRWWATFLPTWNGVGMMSEVIPAEVAGMSLGPSVLCTDMGIPSLLHNPSAVSNACLHSLVLR